MTCTEARLLMSAAVDCEISFIEQEQLQQHLALCAPCCIEFETVKKTKLIVRARLIQFKAPQSLVNSIMELTNADCHHE
uniref:Putative zinc-finger domain-containing protein n=1 Tax=Chlorobium chlorochromatii (strain CaD3) TaxID=340177 RepID=Q3APD5_CHLCH